MARQEKKQDKKKESEKKEESSSAPNAGTVEKGKKIKEDLDKLMEKIDDVLEENAEEFVKNYVQKGGE
jgi:ubiquitin-like protein Pup